MTSKPNYTSPAHRRAFETACSAASALSLAELQAGDTVEKIVRQIRALPNMYHKRRLCVQMADKAIQAEIARRNGDSRPQ